MRAHNARSQGDAASVGTTVLAWGDAAHGAMVAQLSPERQAYERQQLRLQLDGLRDDGLIAGHNCDKTSSLGELRTELSFHLQASQRRQACDQMRESIKTAAMFLEWVNSTLLKNFFNLGGLSVDLEEQLSKPQYRRALLHMHRRVFGSTSRNPWVLIGNVLLSRFVTLQRQAITGDSTVGMLELMARVGSMFGLGNAKEAAPPPASGYQGVRPLGAANGLAGAVLDDTSGAAAAAPAKTARRRTFGA